MPLTTDELTLLREEAESWLVDLCDLYREALTEDAFGGQVATEALIASGISCKVQSGVVHEQTMPEFSALRNAHVFTVSLPHEYDVRLQDNLVLTSHENLKVRVQAVLRPTTYELIRPVIATTEL